MTFISARAPAAQTVVYVADDGAETIREGGSRAWRNNNPGNIEKGSFADGQGAIGGDTRFAIFPDEAVGREAIVALLRSPAYRSLTIAAAINRYAPPSENNTKGYVALVVRETGLDATDVLSALSAAQLAAIADAIKTIEGWTVGIERPNLPFVTLNNARVSPVSSAAVAADDWMRIALTEAALPANERSEWPDPGENPRILNYFRVAAPWFDPKADGGDETDWCAAFVNYCLETAGYRGTGHPGARSFFWNRGNLFIKLAEPRYGAIAVFRDSPFTDATWATGPGHVGFVTDWSSSRIELLGGNQGRTVQRVSYPRESKTGTAGTRRLEGLYVPAMN